MILMSEFQKGGILVCRILDVSGSKSEPFQIIAAIAILMIFDIKKAKNSICSNSCVIILARFSKQIIQTFFG